jgi:hypothetical protein
MAQDEKIFADGFLFKRNEKAPDFVVGRISIKVEDAVAFMKEHQKGGWVNLNVKTARSGNYYIDLDTYEPSNNDNPKSAVDKYEKKDVQDKHRPDEEEDDLPF